MSAFWHAYIWPLVVMVTQSLVLLVALLIFVAYLLYADRKIWAAVQLRRGPNVVGPFGLLQSCKRTGPDPIPGNSILFTLFSVG